MGFRYVTGGTWPQQPSPSPALEQSSELVQALTMHFEIRQDRATNESFVHVKPSFAPQLPRLPGPSGE